MITFDLIIVYVSSYFAMLASYHYYFLLRKPAGRLGEVSPCERSENLEGVWGRGGCSKMTTKMQPYVVSRVGPMAILQSFIPLGKSGTLPGRFPPGEPVGWWWI